MPTWPDSMQRLSEHVSLVPANRTVDEVLDHLGVIETELDGFFSPAGGGPDARRTRRPLPNGVACFNGMYMQVTRAVRDAIASFESPAFVERLDVLFAEFFFQAYDAATAHAWVSKAWAPLFERKDEQGVLPLQFAIAGMNAHINNDLSHALVLTWRELDIRPSRDSPEYRDYVEVNKILEATQKRVRGPLADYLIRDMDTLLGTADDFLALWSIGKAREDAWRRARKMLDEPDADYESFMDRFVGFASHLLLRPTLMPG
jgi:hypothetical protein